MGKKSAYVAKTPNQNGMIEYSVDENLVWQDLYKQQLPHIRRLCAKEYLDGFERINLPQDKVPQCVEVSNALTHFTGWKVKPVAALIGFKKFFELLANKTFPAASFIRSREDFNYIKEPDIFHELFGHTPLLTDPRFAQFSQSIGKAGQKLSGKDYAWLIRLYWFTIEFGLKKTDDGVKALGSGLASSPTELQYSVKGNMAQMREFNVIDILRTPYRIDIHQPVYFVLEDVNDLFAASERNLLTDIKTAQELGLFEPLYDKEMESA